MIIIEGTERRNSQDGGTIIKLEMSEYSNNYAPACPSLYLCYNGKVIMIGDTPISGVDPCRAL